ncbi:M15 family metallopeptidase [Riemerella anatipestifer]|uniref:M15 family metallopeptidase n=1 Tax=Riemerella anatipestifer TaxID=34085 RepID=UPI0021A9F207|nr:M15 family metallopeptidase [Riemerella anatipestifer]WPC11502.1 M15 family metallopeptidase [Riemerella anatipestifer]WPC11517.1 M15 family metallopeptidase [Riemerella anatipestifer]WPC12794.1 M15 family metallopeptidase [Riemerella anatipestifer]WPC12809.1 M15 family metallopeptidase [Riemerella anatipestifer]WPC15355.1 M15 family metallopeptidase [Riemerella anatipestifer]
MDKITLQRIELLHPKLREEAKAIYKEICEALTGNAICRFTHTLRTFQEQNDLYAIGRTKKGRRVTNAKGGQSYHNYGLAIDICLLVDKDGNGTYETAVWDTKADFDNDKIADWQEIVAIFKRYGWTWGGDWRFLTLHIFKKPLVSLLQICKGCIIGKRQNM